MGRSYLEWVRDNISLPWVAIGGIKPEIVRLDIPRGSMNSRLFSVCPNHDEILLKQKLITTEPQPRLISWQDIICPTNHGNVLQIVTSRGARHGKKQNSVPTRIKFDRFPLAIWHGRTMSEALFRMRWPQGFQCPKCGHPGFCEIRDRKVYQCYKCHAQTSVIQGTIFAGTKLPLRIWLMSIYLITQAKDGISSLNLARTVGISANAALRMKHELQQVMKNRDDCKALTGCFLSTMPIGGGKKRDGKRGRGATGKMPFVAGRHLPRYLAEFCYRFNRRFQLHTMVDRLTYVALRTQPVPQRLLKLAEVRW